MSEKEEKKEPKKKLPPLTKEELLREVGRIKTDGFYQYQQVRMTSYNKLRAVIHRRMEEIDIREPQQKKEKEEKDYTKKYADKELPKLLEELCASKKLSQEETDSILELLTLVETTKKTEKEYQKKMMAYVESEPIYTEWLQNIKGISAILTANMLKFFGYCEKYHHVTAIWKSSGLHVVNGHAPKRKRGEKLDFNPKIRTLSYLIGDSFVKKRTTPYREIYDKEKARQIQLMENKAENAPERLLHAELRARRKMVKIFWQHYYLIARDLKGIKSDKPFAFEKLGHNPHHFIEPPHYKLKN